MLEIIHEALYPWRVMRWVGLLVALTVLFVCAPAAAQEDATIESCFSAYEETQVHLKAKRFEKARELARQCSQGCPQEIAEQCQKWTWQAERDAPSVILVARLPNGEDAPEVTVSVDGDWRPLQKEILLDPGQHSISFNREDGWSYAIDVTIHAGEKRRTIQASVPLEGEEEEAPPASTGGQQQVASTLGDHLALRGCRWFWRCGRVHADRIESALGPGRLGSATGLGILLWGGKSSAQASASNTLANRASQRTPQPRATLEVAPAPGGFSAVVQGSF